MNDNQILQEAVNAVILAGGNKAQAARELGDVPRSTLRTWLEKAQRLGIEPTVNAPEVEIKLAQQALVYQAEIKKLKAQLKIALQEGATADSVRSYILNLKDYQPRPPKWSLKHNETGSSGTPILHLSDFHWGETVNSTEVQGLNSYNMSIASKRLQAITTHTIDLCMNHVANPDYPGLILLLGGDMVSGDIHEELSITNERPMLPVVFDLFDNLVACIDALLTAFPEILAYTAFGNHGRTTIKRPYKMAPYLNLDWFLYNMLARHYANDPRVTFCVSDSPDTLFQVYDHQYLLTHGDRLGVRGGDGVVGIIGPIIRGVKKVKAYYGSLGIDVDTVVMGHWHRRIPLEELRVNGSLKGYDEFALSHRFDFEQPVQDLWLTHPKYGQTISMPVFCED